jgi:hypothetical protein
LNKKDDPSPRPSFVYRPAPGGGQVRFLPIDGGGVITDNSKRGNEMNAVEFDTSVLDGKREPDGKKMRDEASSLFPGLQNFTNDEGIAYKESLAKLFKKCGGLKPDVAVS